MHNTAEVSPLDFVDFLEWEHAQPTRHEFLRGEIVAMTGTSNRHNSVSGNFYMLLRQHLRGGRLV